MSNVFVLPRIEFERLAYLWLASDHHVCCVDYRLTLSQIFAFPSTVVESRRVDAVM